MQTIISEEYSNGRRTASRMQKSRASVTSQTSRKPMLKVSNIMFEEENRSDSQRGIRNSMAKIS